MEHIYKVLRNYKVYPLHVNKITGRLYKISDGNKEYALKQANLPKETFSMWEGVYQQAYSKQLTEILPIYLSNSGSLYTMVDGHTYYLQPWLEPRDAVERSEEINPLYRAIGRIHAKTKIFKTIPMQKVKDSFMEYRTFCSQLKKKLYTAVDAFEQSRYMSPLELQICTHFRDIDHAFQKIDERIMELNEIEEKDQQWDRCVCHGNLALAHSIHTDQTYLLNWERAHMDNAIMDLLSFFENETWRYNTPVDELIESFSTYYQENELSKTELLILSIYLLNPSPYLELVDKYMTDPSNDTMVNQVKNVQFTYRKIIFALKWTEHVEREFESISLDDLES
ncbi:phosphotransferase [Virgibacillus sp. SK37]|uniref:phosphotransferase n=1 Tax=Virgibacillus sp. SK37 TaxID=403957 RepID=UPI0004D19706|nr:phosphotransferase [Virgibacillus sp. SK37]AIF45378.1 hypothetical protein X953_09115 [Virgibacillus sp. SK37]